jgi:uncharacterized tellurite resistance protein B-like protein
MNLLSYFNLQLKKQNIEYFIHLVQITKADDNISNNEMELLHRIDRKLGFTNPEIETLILTTSKSDYIPPYELSSRLFEHIWPARLKLS